MFQECLRQSIDDVHLSVNLPDFEFLFCYELLDVMISHLNMLCLRMTDMIIYEVDHAL